MKNHTICFFTKINDKKLLELVQWYKNDIEFLKQTNADLSVATSVKELKKSDLYYSWWASGSIYPLLYAKFFRKPIIVVAGGSEVVKDQKLIAGYSSKSILGKAAVNLVIKLSDKIIAVSNELANEVKKFGRDDVEVIYHGIDTKYYRPANKVKDIIFSISYLDKANVERKRLKTIINSVPYVLEKYPQQKFIIAGTQGNAYQSLTELVRDLGIENNIEFTGNISNEKKLELFQRSLLYLQPTIHEGFGVAIAEAMSCAVPVISSNNTAVKEVLGDTGLFCDPDDPKQLASLTLDLLSDKKRREQLSQRARERVLNTFSIEERNKKLIPLIDGFLNR